MSQINDALKRAGEAPEQPPLPGGPPPLPPLGAGPTGFRTIPPPPVSSSGLPLPVIVVSAALVCIVGLAAFLLFRGFSRSGAVVKARAVPAVAAKADARPAAQNPIAKAAAVAAKVAALGSNTVVVAPSNHAPVAVVATNSFPPLKVQGIFYRAHNPSAMVNGKSVFVGDHVSGATISAITSDSVTVEMNGAKKVLTLY